MLKIIAGTALAAFAAFASPAAAQDWPNRPVTLVVPYAAGGPVDTIARIMAARLSEILGQQMVIENVGGAGGLTGTVRVAKAAPDGYTLLLSGSAVLSQNPTFRKQSPYDPIADFAHVALFSDSARVLIARKDFPADDFKTFLTYTKEHQTTLQYGSPGAGSGGHTCAVLLDGAMGARITHVPYRGAGPAMQDLIGGRIDYMCATIQTGAALINQGQVKGIAVLSETRVPIAPEIPTSGEQGLPGVESSVWNAFFVPKGTPAPVVRRLNKAMSDTLDDANIRKRLEELGLVIVPHERRTPEYLAKFLPTDIARWGKVIQAAGISAD
jgi:tripartite-type tricarboxylate transporter receptor subunit TctC